MVHSKKILFSVIAFILLSLIIILCLYSYNNLDTANAYDMMGKDTTFESGFPFAYPNVITNNVNTNASLNFASLIPSGYNYYSVSLNNITYLVARNNLGTLTNRTYTITPNNHTYNGNTYIANRYLMGGSSTGFSDFVCRMSYPCNVIAGNTYYINFYFDINYVSSNLYNGVTFTLGNGSSLSGEYSLGATDLSAIVSSYYTNLNYNMGDFLFFSIPFTPTSNYDHIGFYNRFKDITFGFNVSVTPQFVFGNLNTYTFSDSFASTNSYIYEYLLYANGGVNPYYLFLQRDNIYCDLLLNNTRFYYLNKTFSNSSFTLNFSNNSSLSTNATIVITPSYMQFNYNGLTSFSFSMSLLDKMDNYQVGFADGYSSANVNNTNSYNDGVSVGYNNGYNVGYTNGLSTASNSSFLGLLTASIESPLNAVLNMFDFELLGYNMKSFYLGLFTVAMILFIIKLFLGNVGGKKGD